MAGISCTCGCNDQRERITYYQNPGCSKYTKNAGSCGGFPRMPATCGEPVSFMSSMSDSLVRSSQVFYCVTSKYLGKTYSAACKCAWMGFIITTILLAPVIFEYQFTKLCCPRQSA